NTSTSRCKTSRPPTACSVASPWPYCCSFVDISHLLLTVKNATIAKRPLLEKPFLVYLTLLAQQGPRETVLNRLRLVRYHLQCLGETLVSATTKCGGISS